MSLLKHLLLTSAVTTAFAFEPRILTTLTIDVVDDDTGATTTSVLNLRDGDVPAEAAVSFCSNAVKEPTADCADVLHQAIEAQLQQRIDQDLAFYFEVNFDDHPNLNTSPFLFFKGEDVNDAVLSYLQGHPAVATQESYDMLVQACWSRLTPMEEIVKQTAAEKPAVVLVDEETKDNDPFDDAEDTIEDSAFYHCEDHFGSHHDPQFLACVQELWHGWGAMTVYQPTTDVASSSSFVTFDFGEKCYNENTLSKEDNVDEKCEMKKNTGTNFGSSTTPIIDSFFTWSMFSVLCSMTFLAVLFVTMKIQDDVVEEQIVAELNCVHEEFATTVTDKENTPVIVSKRRKSTRAQTTRRTFGRSLNNC